MSPSDSHQTESPEAPRRSTPPYLLSSQIEQRDRDIDAARETCIDWFDGRRSAMWQFAFAEMPHEGQRGARRFWLRLASEAQRTFTDNTIRKEDSRLAHLAAFAQREAGRLSMLQTLDRELRKARELGFDIEQIAKGFLP